MDLENPKNGENRTPKPDLQLTNNGLTFDLTEIHHFSDEIDSTCSTPYVSAPSSPGRNPNGYFFSAPASPMHFMLCSSSSSSMSSSSAFVSSSEQSFEFEFSARFSSNTSSIPSGSMSSADELFLNGQIRPMKLSSHLQRPQVLAPLIDLNNEEDDEEFQFVKRVDSMARGRDMRVLREKSLHRRTRSLSPLRSSWYHKEHLKQENNHDDSEEHKEMNNLQEEQVNDTETPSTETTPSVSASTSRSSSSGRNSKRWLFLKEFLRSKSEGRGNLKDKFWYSFSEKRTSSSSSISKDKTAETLKSKSLPAKQSVAGKPANGIAKRRVPPSPHELHYTAKRAQAEEMRKKTFLPYRQGLFGCLGFSSKGYNAVNVFTRSLNPVSSR